MNSAKKIAFDAAIDVDAELSNENAHQQRSGDATKHEASDPDFSNEVTKRNGYEECEQGLCGHQPVQ